MKLRFLWIGQTKDPFLKLENLYLDRIGRFFPVERSWIVEGKKADRHQRASQLDKESQRLRARLAAGTRLVCLDEKGRQLSSVQLARFLGRYMNQGVGDVTFLAGGHQGLPEEMLESADAKLSLSKMTLPHQLARVLLLEQVYRAITLIRGLPYHK